MPDVEVSLDRKSLLEGRDPQLEAAISYIKGTSKFRLVKFSPSSIPYLNKLILHIIQRLQFTSFSYRCAHIHSRPFYLTIHFRPSYLIFVQWSSVSGIISCQLAYHLILTSVTCLKFLRSLIFFFHDLLTPTWLTVMGKGCESALPVREHFCHNEYL